MKNILSIIILLIFNKLNFSQTDFKKYFDEFKVEGSFSMLDMTKNEFTYYNQKQFKQQFIPASTFKICNSLIGIETSVIKDENFVIKWDSVQRQVPEWNQDLKLKDAFRYSAVWWYQEIARRIGGERMFNWLNKCNYGNMDTTGGLDKFWLSGGLRVTPEQQIDFIKRLYKNELPFSQNTMDVVKTIMINEQTNDYTLRTKTGWGLMDETNIGWFVGYLENKDNVYIFATCVQTKNPDENFGKSRKEITIEIFKELGLIK